MLGLKETWKELLREADVPVENAGDWKLGRGVLAPSTYISLRQITGKQGALQQYLGTDEAGNESYGMEMQVKFALVLLSPKEQGASGAETFGEKVMNGVLLVAGQMGVEEILCSETAYDSLRDCFRQEITLKSRVMACGTKTDSGITLTKFRILATVR